MRGGANGCRRGSIPYPHTLSAWPGGAWRGGARRGKARLGGARHGASDGAGAVTAYSLVRVQGPHASRLGVAGRGEVWRGWAWQGMDVGVRLLNAHSPSQCRSCGGYESPAY